MLPAQLTLDRRRPVKALVAGLGDVGHHDALARGLVATLDLGTLSLALAFLLAIGVMLIADGFGHHVPKGYIYFAMAFSLFVELPNMRSGARAGRPVKLREG